MVTSNIFVRPYLMKLYLKKQAIYLQACERVYGRLNSPSNSTNHGQKLHPTQDLNSQNNIVILVSDYHLCIQNLEPYTSPTTASQFIFFFLKLSYLAFLESICMIVHSSDCDDTAKYIELETELAFDHPSLLGPISALMQKWSRQDFLLCFPGHHIDLQMWEHTTTPKFFVDLSPTC